MKLKIVIHPEANGNFSAAVPALPGCFSCGNTLDEARANIREAIAAWLEAGDERLPFAAEDRSPSDLVEEVEL